MSAGPNCVTASKRTRSGRSTNIMHAALDAAFASALIDLGLGAQAAQLSAASCCVGEGPSGIGEQLRGALAPAAGTPGASEQRDAEPRSARRSCTGTGTGTCTGTVAGCMRSSNDALDHPQRQLVTAEGRHHVGAGHAVLHLRPTSRARWRCPRCAQTRPSPPCACARGCAPGSACRAPRCAGTRRCDSWPAARGRPAPGCPSGSMSRSMRSSTSRVVHRLRHHQLGAGIALLAQAIDLALVVERAAGSAPVAHKNCVAPPSGLPPGSKPRFSALTRRSRPTESVS